MLSRLCAAKCCPMSHAVRLKHGVMKTIVRHQESSPDIKSFTLSLCPYVWIKVQVQKPTCSVSAIPPGTGLLLTKRSPWCPFPCLACLPATRFLPPSPRRTCLPPSTSCLALFLARDTAPSWCSHCRAESSLVVLRSDRWLLPFAWQARGRHMLLMGGSHPRKASLFPLMTVSGKDQPKILWGLEIGNLKFLCFKHFSIFVSNTANGNRYNECCS